MTKPKETIKDREQGGARDSKGTAMQTERTEPTNGNMLVVETATEQARKEEEGGLCRKEIDGLAVSLA